MKRTITTLGALMAWTTPAIAAGAETTETSLITFLFFGFAALIVVAQLIPGLILIYGMIKGLFGKTVKGHA
jgi:hypothetical protein